MRRAFRQSLVPQSRATLIKAIHAQGRTLGLADDVRKDLQKNLTGIESCADMDVRQLQAVYGRLSALAAAIPGAKPYILKAEGRTQKAGGRTGRDERLPEEPISAEQMEKIKHLAEAVNYQGPRLRSFSDWCKKTCGSPWPQTRAEANKVIEALKAMRNRGWRARVAT